MRQRKKPLKYLLLSILSFAALFYIIFFIPPTLTLPFFTLQIPILVCFFLALFLFCFFLPTYLFESKAHGLLIGLFVISALLFRLNNLTHPFFLILLAALFVTLELLFTYRK